MKTNHYFKLVMCVCVLVALLMNSKDSVSASSTIGTCSAKSSSSLGSAYSELFGTAAVSVGDVWAVGVYNNPNNVYQTLIEHWNGSQWSIVLSPNRGSFWNQLNSVAAIAANDIWAVGYYSNGGADRTLIEHWNGTKWSIVPSPNLNSSGDLYGIAATSTNDVWAVGYGSSICISSDKTLIEHWDGTKWNVVPSPNNGGQENYLYGVAVVSASDIWATGYYNDTSDVPQSLTEHWNGKKWKIIPSINPATGNELLAVTAVLSSDVWAVGIKYLDGLSSPLIEQWNGTQWTFVPCPQPYGSGEFYGAAAVSANDVWAVGYLAAIDSTLIEQWNGTQWSVVPSPNPGRGYNPLSSVTAISASDVWAVGGYMSGLDSLTLIEQWNGTQWNVVPSPNPN